MSPIRVLLADDHKILREGLISLLEREPDIEVVADAEDGRSAIRLARELRPDVVVMDIGMPDLNGVEATREIVSQIPNARVLCLSVHREASVVRAVLEAGASGYLLKTSAAEELVQAVRSVAEGHSHLSPPVAADVIARHVRAEESGGSGAYGALTPREREVLQLVAEGHHAKKIATRLGISHKTVLAHRGSLMRKLDVHSVAALIRYALREGVTEL